jgi:hypothetical protein
MAEILNRDQVRAALRFEGPLRPPVAMSYMLHRKTLEKYGDKLRRLMEEFPEDTARTGMAVDFWYAPADDPTYRWAFGDKKERDDLAIDSRVIIEDWRRDFPLFIAEFPDPRRPDAIRSIESVRNAEPDRYILCGFGHFFHQKLAYFRGLENLLIDLYENRDYLKRTMNRLLDFYSVHAERAARVGADGINAGDDLGTQRSLFFSPEMFREVYKPFYAQLGDIFHSHGLDYWLHTCGNIYELIPDLIDCGIDALHPIQAGTMNDSEVSAEFGGKITFWVGMDVQHLLPFGTVNDVREGVAARMRSFYDPKGGMILAAGNVILPHVPLENIRAFAETLVTPLV